MEVSYRNAFVRKSLNCCFIHLIDCFFIFFSTNVSAIGLSFKYFAPVLYLTVKEKKSRRELLMILRITPLWFVYYYYRICDRSLPKKDRLGQSIIIIVLLRVKDL